MDARAIWVVMALETIVAAGFMLINPLITRRGLLFGAGSLSPLLGLAGGCSGLSRRPSRSETRGSPSLLPG